ncbi:MAG: hypothetical protein M3500_10305 [Actinomycetota bacterium]|nr:hypothetical protein [Actinomycetota bacterium]
MTMATPATGRKPAGRHPSRSVLAWWLALLGIAIGLWWLVGTPEPGAVEPRRTGEAWPLYGVAPVLVAAVVLVASYRRVHERVAWPLLLLAGYLAAAAWTLAIAATDGALWTSVVAGSETAPPLPGRLLLGLAGSGVHGALAATLLSLVGALASPLAVITVRALCDELSARRLLPVLVLAPYALVGTSVEAIALALGAATLVVAALASEKGRPGLARLALAVLCGLLLGTAALFGYAAILLAAGAVCVFFVRRRPLLNIATAAGFFVPLVIARAAGLDWTEDLADALRNGDGGHRYAEGLVAAVVVLLILGGPALVASLRSMRRTPAWPLLVAGGAAVVASVVAGILSDRLAPGAWLPALPWLLVAATAPARQGGRSVPTPLPVVAVGAASAYALALLIAP